MKGPLVGTLRLLRAGVFAVAAVLLSVAAHLLGGGRLPSVGVLVILLVPMTLLAVLLARRTRGAALLGATLGLAQLISHQVLGALAGMPPSRHGCAVAASSHLAHQVGSLASGCPTAAGHGAATTSGLPMLLAHVVATALTAVLLARGDRFLAYLWARLRGVRVPRLVVLVPLRRLPAPQPSPVAPAPRVAAGGTCRRGPPRPA